MTEILAFTRALHVTGCLLLFGVFVFRTAIAPAALVGAPPDTAKRLERRFDQLGIASFALSIAAGFVWLPLQAAAMSGAESMDEVAWATVATLRKTLFGQVFLARLALLLGAGSCLLQRDGMPVRRQWAMATGAVLSGGAVLLFSAAGHAVALEGIDRSAMLAVQALHLAAAGAWLGSLLPLALTLLILPPRLSARAAVRFSPLGIASVAALLVTGWFNGQIFVRSLSALFGTAYGRWVLVKSALFVIMVGLAMVNRLKLTQGLLTRDGTTTARRMRLSVLLEASAGAAIVVIAAVLVSTTPGVHVLQTDPGFAHGH